MKEKGEIVITNIEPIDIDPEVLGWILNGGIVPWPVRWITRKENNMSELKNEKYVDALWKCYKKGLTEIDGVGEKELFMHLIDDAVNQIVGNVEQNPVQPVVSQSGGEAAVEADVKNAGVEISKETDDLKSEWYTYWYECPNCMKGKYINTSFDYCPNCGIKINWVE